MNMEEQNRFEAFVFEVWQSIVRMREQDERNREQDRLVVGDDRLYHYSSGHNDGCEAMLIDVCDHFGLDFYEIIDALKKEAE